jgi:hypothetical protein
MQKTYGLFAIAILVSLVGCGPQQKVDPSLIGQTRIGDLQVTMELPQKFWMVGERAEVTVTIENLSRKPIEIVGDSNAPVQLTLMRKQGISWRVIKQYPQTVSRVMKRWTLAPQSSRKITIEVPVEPDWPAAEPLQLSAEVNGLHGPAPIVMLEVLP